MWPLFRKKPEPIPEPHRRRVLTLDGLLEGMGDLRELDTHDTALKFWLPEPAEKALAEFAQLQGSSMSSMLREFLATHCYGTYAIQLLRDREPEIFKDPNIRYSIGGTEDDRKVRKITYWVPELGKNVAPVKIWVSKRLRGDLQALADHVGIPLSQYLREIAISRLLGHGMLPKRPEMLAAAPLPSADAWCEDREVPWIEVDEDAYRKNPEGRREIEWEDEADPPES